MDTVTYSKNDVAEFIEKYMVPVRVAADHKPLADDFRVKWTPLTVILDHNGQEQQRVMGFLEPDNLKALLLLGTAKEAFHADNFDTALIALDAIVSMFPRSAAAPEALFLSGVCYFKRTHNPQPLKEAYEKLLEEYPASEWTSLAYPYRLL